MRALPLCLAVLLLTAACSAGTDAAPDAEARRGAVDALATGLWAPAHAELASRAVALESAITWACEAEDATALEAVREAWVATSDQWASMRAVRFGPVRDLRLDGTMRFEIDAEKIDRLATELPDVERLRNVGADVKGLDAIEHLLFADAPIDAASCRYAAGVATLVREAADEMAAAWEAYPAELAEMPAQDGIDMAVNELIFALRELEMDHLAPAAGLSAPDDADEVEGRSRRGARVATALATGARDAYLGMDDGSIAALVIAASAEADGRLRTALDELATILDGLPDSWPDADPAAVGRALELAGEARTALATEVASLLGVTISLGDSDGDS
jgi:Imelysin